MVSKTTEALVFYFPQEVQSLRSFWSLWSILNWFFFLIGWRKTGSKSLFSSGLEKGCLSFCVCFGAFMGIQVGIALWVCFWVFCSLGLCVCCYTSSLLFLLPCLCSVIWGQVLWYFHHCSFSSSLPFCTSYFWNGSQVESQLLAMSSHICLLSLRISSVLGPLQQVLAPLVCLSLSWLGLDYCSLESCGPGPGCSLLGLFPGCSYLSLCVKVSLLGIMDSPNLSCICYQFEGN